MPITYAGMNDRWIKWMTSVVTVIFLIIIISIIIIWGVGIYFGVLPSQLYALPFTQSQTDLHK